MNLVLCGMMGSGKTTVSLALSKRLGWERVDTDECIASRYGKIADIFEKQGEGHFRVLETKICAELAQKDCLVISTGGGLVLKKENVELLKKKGTIVYLRASIPTLVKRLSADENRPLLQGGDLEERLTSLLKARSSIYEEVSAFFVDVDDKTPEELAEEIIGHVRDEK